MAAGSIQYVVWDLDDTIYDLGARDHVYAAGSQAAMAAHFTDLRRHALEAGVDLRMVALTAKEFPDDITDDFIDGFAKALDHPAVVETRISEENGSSLVSYNHRFGRALVPQPGPWSARRHFRPEELPSGQLPLVNIIQGNVTQGSGRRRALLTDKGAALAWMAEVTGVPIEHFVLVDDSREMRQLARRAGAKVVDASPVFNRDRRSWGRRLPPADAFENVMAQVKALVLPAAPAVMAAAGPRKGRDGTAAAGGAWAEGDESDSSLSTAGGAATGAAEGKPAAHPKSSVGDSRPAEPAVPAWQSRIAAAIDTMAATWRGNGRRVQADALVAEGHSLSAAGLSAVQGALANPRSDFSHLLNTGGSRWAFCCCCGGTSADYLKVCEIVPRTQAARAAAAATDAKPTDRTPLLG